MASGTTDKDTTCTCLTEQGTKAKVRLPVCVAIARDGSAYNPCNQPGQSDEDIPNRTWRNRWRKVLGDKRSQAWEPFHTP